MLVCFDSARAQWHAMQKGGARLHGNRGETNSPQIMRSVERLLMPLAVHLIAACSDPVRPPVVLADREAVITTSADGRELWMLEPTGGSVVARLSLGGVLAGGVAATADGGMLYAGVRSDEFREHLVAINTSTMSRDWSLALSTQGRPNELDGIELLTGEAVALTLDPRRLFLWRARKDGVTGATILDVSTRRPIGFTGPWNVAGRGLVPLRFRTPEGANTVALVGSRHNPSGGPLVRSNVYLLDSQSMQAVDSITAEELGERDIFQLVPSPTSDVVYIAGSGHLLRYNLAKRLVTAQVARPASGALAISPDGQTLILTDGGSWPDFPGTGVLHLFGADLVPSGTIDVSTTLGGRPNGLSATVMGMAAVSQDGTTAYLRTGTPPLGPLYPVQPARLLVVDLVGRRVSRAIDLAGYGLGPVIVRQRK